MGRIRCTLRQQENMLNLLDHQWTLISFVEWMIDSIPFFFKPLQIGTHTPLPNESLAACIQRLYDTDHPPPEEDTIYDELYTYRTQHALRFALRGADIPDIMIGLNHNQGDISRYHHHYGWYYTFDLQHSIYCWLEEYERFLDQWQTHVASTSISVGICHRLMTKLFMLKANLPTII